MIGSYQSQGTGSKKMEVTKMKSKKEIKEALDGICDKVMAKKDGSYEVRRGYFYRHGITAEKLAEGIKHRIPEAAIQEVQDHWAPWPRDSYFRVTFVVPGSEVQS